MSPYQSRLGANFSQFISWFISADVDYQIAVVTTDMESATKSGRIQGQIIRPDTPNAEGAFSQIVNVGISGSGYETGLEAAYRALTPPLVEGPNAGFLRDDASLSIIFVSDEEDGSPLPVNDYINAFVGIKGARNRDVFNASALVVTDIGTCQGLDPRYDSSEGHRYIDVARQTGGMIGNLCDSDFEKIVFDLSLNTSRLRNVYYMSSEPNLASLQVAVDDDIIPCDDGRWRFDFVEDERQGELRPAIVFEPDQIPAVGSRITARYFPGGADVGNFCRSGS
jgi:hypothetical protein